MPGHLGIDHVVKFLTGPGANAEQTSMLLFHVSLCNVECVLVVII